MSSILTFPFVIPLFQLAVILIRNRLAPFVFAVFTGDFQSDVAEPAVRLRSVPVLDLCRDGNDHAGRQAHGRFALLLIPALSGCADQQLSAALACMVDVPVVPAARLKGDVVNG